MKHSDAKRIIDAAFVRVHNREPSPEESLYCQAVAWLETHYGRHPGQHAEWASQGLFTWGNIEKAAASCSPPWYPGTDAGNKRCFLLRNSDEDAAVDLVKNLTARHWPVLQAIATQGTPESVAEAMKAVPAYYEAPMAQYAAGLRNAVKAIQTEVPIPSVVSASPFPWTTLLVAAAVGAAGAYLVLYPPKGLHLPRLLG
jgi:hypothetical protein